MRMSPSCACCGECLELFDNFDDGSLGSWEEEVGSWEDAHGTGGQHLQTEDANAQIIFRDPGVITPGSRWKIQVDAAPGTYTDGANATVRWWLIFGWQSTTDFWYAEFKMVVVSNIVTYSFRIVQVASGTPDMKIENTTPINLGEYVVCYQDGVVTVYTTFDEGEAISYDTGTTIGGEFGLGTGALSNVILVQYDDWFLFLDTGDGNCDECP